MASAAQTMLLTANVSSHVKGLPLLQRLKPKPFSHSILPPKTNTFSSSSFLSTKTFALFKSKTKAPAKKAPVVKEKPKVEDGIFGTSGGIGFTKQNELFVGRVAMIGFAVSFFFYSMYIVIIFKQNNNKLMGAKSNLLKKH